MSTDTTQIPHLLLVVVAAAASSAISTAGWIDSASTSIRWHEGKPVGVSVQLGRYDPVEHKNHVATHLYPLRGAPPTAHSIHGDMLRLAREVAP